MHYCCFIQLQSFFNQSDYVQHKHRVTYWSRFSQYTQAKILPFNELSYMMEHWPALDSKWVISIHMSFGSDEPNWHNSSPVQITASKKLGRFGLCRSSHCAPPQQCSATLWTIELHCAQCRSVGLSVLSCLNTVFVTNQPMFVVSLAQGSITFNFK